MLRIFVSSTFRDLKQERAAVREVIDDLAQRHPVAWVGMEEFGSFAASPFQVSTAFAEKADIVVLIVARSYGSVAPDRGLSFTDAELNVVLRDKIPCLAYLEAADEAELDPQVAGFRQRINRELTSSAYADIHELARNVRHDLERELQGYSGEPSPGGLALEAMPGVDPGVFQGREEALEQLGNGLAREAARVGVWGSRGIGKTTLVYQFFRLGKERYDPVWLRVDDLFGRYPDGRPRIGVGRWPQEALLQELKGLLKERPRAVLVFDNVQAAPLLVAWLASRLGETRGVFLAWDLGALPPCQPIIKLNPLYEPEARRLLLHYCHVEQAYEEAELSQLLELLENDPFMLTLAGRRLHATPALTVAELVAELKQAGARLELEGPTADAAGETVRALLLSSYHALNGTERQTLSALAALPARGISEDSLGWLVRRVTDGLTRGLDRAEQLELLERRRVADWRGHRYRLRSLVVDFLKTTDGFAPGGTLVDEYLMSVDVLADSSVDMVSAALQRQLEAFSPNLPGGTWPLQLLVHGRPAIRDRVRQLLAGWGDERQVALLAEQVAGLLSQPRSEDVTLELTGLLESWGRPESVERLERLWLEPEVLYGDGLGLLNNVALAAGKALAAQQGTSLADFLRRRLQSADTRQIQAALFAIAVGEMPEMTEDVINLLDHPDHQVRTQAAEALATYRSRPPEIADRLFQVFSSDPHPDVRFLAASTLGVWADRRVLPYFLTLLQDDEPDTRAWASSTLWHFRQPEVADALYHQALRDNAVHVTENCAFALSDFRDPRAGELCLRLLQRPDDERSQLLGAGFASLPGLDVLPQDVVRSITDLLAGWLDTKPLTLRLAARGTLLDFHDPRGHSGLWQDLKETGDVAADQWRAVTLQKLAGWRPPDFEPLRLRPLLQDPYPSVRAHAALVAGQAGARELVEELLSLLEDDAVDSVTQQTVATFAREALDRIEGKREPWQPLSRSPVQPSA